MSNSLHPHTSLCNLSIAFISLSDPMSRIAKLEEHATVVPGTTPHRAPARKRNRSGEVVNYAQTDRRSSGVGTGKHDGGGILAGSLQCSNQESSRFLKSGSEPPCRYYEFDDFRIDAVKSVLLQCGIPVPLPPKAFEVLLALVRRNRAAVTKNELLSTIWPDTFVEESNLTQYVLPCSGERWAKRAGVPATF